MNGTPVTETPATVLLVEDEWVVRRLASVTLRSAGYTVLEAADGREAALAADSCPGPIDLLLSDVCLPGMSGLKLAERLAAARPGLKVLFCSGHDQDVVGGAPFLPKPFSAPALVGRVREVLGRGT